MTKYSEPDSTVSVTLKIPVRLLKKLEEKQLAERLDRTNLIIKCIESYLEEGKTKTEITPLQKAEEIKTDIDSITATMKNHDAIVKDLTAAIAALTKTDR